MDYQSQTKQPMNRQTASSSKFTALAIIFAILSFFNLCFLPICLVFGSLAIVFAVLSKGQSLKMKGLAIMSVVIASCCLVFSTIITSLTIYMTIYNKEYRALMNQQFEVIYGESFDDYLKEYEEYYDIDIPFF